MDVRQVYEEYVRPLPLADRLRLAERIVAQAAAEAAEPSTPVEPPLGVRLRAIRARIEQAGEPLLDEEALRKEVAARRGGVEAWDEAERANLR